MDAIPQYQLDNTSSGLTGSASRSYLLGDVFDKVSDLESVRLLMEPFFQINYFTMQDLATQNKMGQLHSGKIKKHIRFTFEVSQLRSIRMPCENSVRFLNTTYEHILFFQYKAQPTRFDVFMQHQQYCRSRDFEIATLRWLQLIVPNYRVQLRNFSFVRTKGGISYTSIRTTLLQNSGHEISHQLVFLQNQNNIVTPGTVLLNRGNSGSQSKKSNKQSQQQQQSQEEGVGQASDAHMSEALLAASANQCFLPLPHHQMVVTNSKGQVFDMHHFAKHCIQIMENMLFFTENAQFRSIQADTNKDRKALMLRLFDHRPFLHDLWNETMQFALGQPSMVDIAPYFTKEQIALLFNCHKTLITSTFNTIVLGNGGGSQLVQPHPVRALLDSTPFLMGFACFDLAWYSYQQYGFNFLTASYYIGKNFLSDDSSLTNSKGAICFLGAPGSGKSRISQVLLQFFNGFTYQDGGKGIGEFQNYDISTKSFILSEEVALKRLGTPDWKKLADLQVSIKCKQKNQQDVEVTKYVPVAITSNGNITADILDHILESPDVQAAHRRWMFIRYFESWASSHPEIFDKMGVSIAAPFIQAYSHSGINHELMNAMIACALLFPDHDYVTQDYIIPYYAHCLQAFSKTMFGQIALSNWEHFAQQVNMSSQTYCTGSDTSCYNLQKRVQEDFERMCTCFVGEVFCLENGFDLEWQAFRDYTNPLYLKCMQLCSNSKVKAKMAQTAERVLHVFLNANASKPLYGLIMTHLQNEGLMAVEILDDMHQVYEDNESVLEKLDQQVKDFDFDLVSTFLGGVVGLGSGGDLSQEHFQLYNETSFNSCLIQRGPS